MSQAPRKFIPAERSVQKERASYQSNNPIKNYDTNFYDLNKATSPAYYVREERLKPS